MQKSPDAFRTISEVASELDVPQHVLRFWETRFSTIRPLKRGGGRRYYRPDDVDLLKGIRQLLYGQGYTIKGVQRILKQDGLRFVQAVGRGEEGAVPAPRDEAPDEDFPPAEDEGFSAEPAATGGTERAYGATESRPPARAAAAQAEPSTPSSPSLSADSVARLKSALEELTECERILGTLREE